MAPANPTCVSIVIGLVILGACTMALADATDCKNLKDDDKTDVCLRKQAETLQKPALCDDIIAGSVRASCFASLGLALHRDDLCAKAEDQRVVAECLTHLALMRHEVKACGSIRHVYEQGRCVTAVANQTRALELCAEIKIRKQRVDCQRELAKSTKSPDICAKLDFWHDRDSCYAVLVEDQGMDLSLCERIEGPGVRGACYHMASPRDPRACEHVGGPRSKARAACYEWSVSRRKDPAACDVIKDPYLADKCLTFVGKETHVASLCERVKDWVLRDECFSRLTVESPDYCLEIQSRPWRRRCATSNWRRSKNPEICQLLREPDRTECRARVDVTSSTKGK
jgi:hypothetical protein